VTKNLALMTFAASVMTSALFFQNCARVAFGTNSQMVSSLNGDGSQMPNFPADGGDGIGPMLPPAPVASPPPAPGGSSGDQEIDGLVESCQELENYSPPESSPQKCDKDLSVTSSTESRVFDDVRDLRLTSVHADFSVSGARDVRMTSVRGNISIQSQSVQLTSYDAAKPGDRLRINTVDFNGMTAVKGRVLINATRFRGSTAVQGELCVRAKDFGSLTAVNGAVELIGAGAQRSNGGSLTAVNGLLILKNMNLQSIVSVNGKLVLINSHVERITSLSGPVYMQNSTVGSTVSARGGMIQF
jgi:hypothetical protein